MCSRGVGEDVGDDPHRRPGRVDVGVADHELLEDVVLDGPGQLLGRHPLLLGGDDVEREHRQHRAVHRHRHAHLVERDAVEELPHVVDGVDRHPGHADVPGDPRVVGVVAAVGGEVERDRQALLPGGEVAAVERVRLLGGGEPGVLADRPRLGRVHRRVRPAQVRRDARIGGEAVLAGGGDLLQVVGGVERPDRDPLGGLPHQVLGVLPGRLAHRLRPPVPAGRGRAAAGEQLDLGEVRNACRGAGAHRVTPRSSRVVSRTRIASQPVYTLPSTPS